jgi:hypothetical protein
VGYFQDLVINKLDLNEKNNPLAIRAQLIHRWLPSGEVKSPPQSSVRVLRMCYPTTINLPPRYVHRIKGDSETSLSKTSTLIPGHATKVQFHLDSNEVYILPMHSGRTTWYTAKDFADFATAWKTSRIRHQKSVRRSNRQATDLMKMAAGRRQQKPIPTMEELRMMRPQASVCRESVVQSILIHQAQCRAKGFNDPDGYAFLSKALSKSDKKFAWQVAAINAHEVQALCDVPLFLPQKKQSPSSSDLSGLVIDYYYESVHPYLSQPLVFMSKLLLCECD